MSTHHIKALASAAFLLMLACAPPVRESDVSLDAAPPGMVWIPGGEFTQGTDEQEAYPAERAGSPGHG